MHIYCKLKAVTVVKRHCVVLQHIKTHPWLIH